MATQFTSLLRIEERLSEAAYFCDLMERERHEAFDYVLNAYTSSARSVTFLLQKEMLRVPSFDVWWRSRQDEMRKDRAARFFLFLRNYSQKEGRISLVGSYDRKRGQMAYRFAGNDDAVPPELLHRDVVDCCREHLAKLARLVMAFSEAFPFHCCPARALTPAGIAALGISVEDVARAAGYPEEWFACAPGGDIEAVLRFMQREVDPVDFGFIQQLANYSPMPAASLSDDLGDKLARLLVERLEARDIEPTGLVPAIVDHLLKSSEPEGA